MANARVLLTTLSVRTSAKGRPYLSGFLGKSRVVAFEGEADRFGNPTWDIFVAEPEPRDGRRRPASARQAARPPPQPLEAPARASPLLAAPTGRHGRRAREPGRNAPRTRCCATTATRS